MSPEQLKKIKAVFLITIGGIAIICGIVCFLADTGTFERQTSYGGDAYTGIQNAGAITANNVKCVAQLTSLGFGFAFLITGLILISNGILPLLLKVEPTAIETSDASSAKQAIDSAVSAPSVKTPSPQKTTHAKAGEISDEGTPISSVSIGMKTPDETTS